jgi:YegS/Rv2252/BmrU family lipid kinase
MLKTLVIFNPVARGEKSQRLRAFLEAKRGATVDLAPTRCAGDAQVLAAEGVAKGYEVIVAAGGDGTVNEVINGLQGAKGKVALGVLPMGTVNVFALELGIPYKLEAAWRVIEGGKVRTIDLGCAEAQGRRRYFGQLAGVGFDAQTVHTNSWELKKKIGSLSYIWAALKVFWEAPRVVEVTPGGKGSIVLIGNGRLYGGRLALFPEARMDDGKLDVCVFEGWSTLAMMRYLMGVLRGKHTRLADVKYFQAEAFECRGEAGTVMYELDGELVGEAPVRFSVVRGGLRVVVPEG